MITDKNKQIILSILLIIAVAIGGYSLNQIKTLKNHKAILEDQQHQLTQNITELNALNTESNSMVKQLTIELQNMNTEKLALQNTLNNTITLDDLSRDYLRDKGYEDYALILDDLMNQNHLIPYEGVLGGSMAWRPEGSFVLNYQWVYASFDDGHIQGHGLLRFKIRNDKTIEWTVVDSDLYGVE